MIIAIHQANFIPWLPYFDKMNKADIFVIMINCQFEKNGWQNRCEVNEKKWTMPVKSGKDMIANKQYVGGMGLPTLNIQWINAIAMTLGIDVGKIRLDFPTKATGTDRIIEICDYYGCDEYLTNPDATVKYLNDDDMAAVGIDIVPHVFEHNIHVFEAFQKWGISGTQKILRKEQEKFWRERCET